MFVGDCCFSLCVKKGGMFEKKTLPLSLSFSTLSIQINHKVNEDRSRNRVSNEYAREQTHVGNKLENKKSGKSGEYSILLECLQRRNPAIPRKKKERPKVGENSPHGVETTMTLTGW